MPRQHYDSDDGWYGIMVNGELGAVQQFRTEPTCFDFHLGFFSSDFDYQVVDLSIQVLGYRRPCE